MLRIAARDVAWPPEDWGLLRTKIDRLPEFDLEEKHLTTWHAMLVPVLDQLVNSAEGKPDLHFWDRVCCHKGGGSGPRYLSGWVTVFTVFTAKGEWQADRCKGDMRWGRDASESEWPM